MDKRLEYMKMCEATTCNSISVGFDRAVRSGTDDNVLTSDKETLESKKGTM